MASDLPAASAVAPTSAKGTWVNISDPVVASLKQQQSKIGFPGQTAGITVDSTTGDVFLVVPAQGLWKSTDHGATFARCDGGATGGRCETGFALNADPAGKRLACFMLDGGAAMSLDAGATWKKFKDVGRNWDFGAVDWSVDQPQVLFAMRHESMGELFLSEDAGSSWRVIARNTKLQAVGLFDKDTLLTTNGDGVALSVDGGKNWRKVSDYTPLSRVMQVVHGVGWWISEDGLISSTDKGQTWQKVGTAVLGTLGPFFDPRDVKHIMVAGRQGFFETVDSGTTWKHVVDLPDGYAAPSRMVYQRRMGPRRQRFLHLLDGQARVPIRTVDQVGFDGESAAITAGGTGFACLLQYRWSHRVASDTPPSSPVGNRHAFGATRKPTPGKVPCAKRTCWERKVARTIAAEDRMIRKLKSGQYRLYSKKQNPKTGKRRNLGTFDSRDAAEKHERDVQYFKRH